MKHFAEAIYDIIKDYQHDFEQKNFQITVDHILNWANQFEEDAAFILKELLYILPKVYISKEKARDILRRRLKGMIGYYKYDSMKGLIENTHFFDVQSNHKSQPELLQLIDNILQEEFDIEYKSYNHKPKHNFVYFDDILATGGTVFRDLNKWLTEKDNGLNENFKAVLNGTKTLELSFFCYHQLGFGNMKYRLMKVFDDRIGKKMLVNCDYIIENQVKWPNQKLNCIYPNKNQSVGAMDYLAKLENTIDRIPPFRPQNMPKEEVFFSSPKNRQRMESIFLEKGLEILRKIKSGNPDKRKRPLGDTVKSHGTFGTGTLFFTWRNISNTCPLVFWWNVPGHNWTPLFNVKNRGSKLN